jgi:hypothetical protein
VLVQNEAHKAVGDFRYENELGETEMAELQSAILACYTELGYDVAFSWKPL